MRSSHPVLLSIDTSTRIVGLALYNGFQVLSEQIWTSHDHHTVELAPAVSNLLESSQLKPTDLGAIAVALGPGSFTGLRIGLAFAKGLVLAQNLSLIGIPSLDVLAAAQPVLAEKMAAVLLAGRGRLAVSWYQADGQSWRTIGKIEVLTVQELLECIQSPTQICGELTDAERKQLGGKHKLIQLASPAASLRRPSYLAELAWERWQIGQFDDPASLSPIYLHYNDPIPG